MLGVSYSILNLLFCWKEVYRKQKLGLFLFFCSFKSLCIAGQHPEKVLAPKVQHYGQYMEGPEKKTDFMREHF